MREYKVVVAGSGGVGKSALTVQFVQGCFVSAYDATIEDSYRKIVRFDTEDCRLEILDTAGTEQFSGMRDLYVRSGQGFVLVYSVDDEHSFRQVEPLADHILRLKGHKPPLVIVGNKSDLGSLRRVATTEGKALASRLRCSFFETSAKLNENVSEVFFDCLRQIRAMGGDSKRRKHIENSKNGRCCTLI